MTSVVSINCQIPTAEGYIGYTTGESLRDYDIAIFNPRFPYLDRIYFNGGGSCISIESTQTLTVALRHWRHEFDTALKSGKTIFVILDEIQTDQAATSSELKAKQRTYSTTTVKNYSALPFKFDGRNAQGRKILSKSPAFSGLLSVLKDVLSYRVVLEPSCGTMIFGTKDNAPLGSIVKLEGCSGSIVLLPYFDFDADHLLDTNADGEAIWTEAALATSRAVVGQLVAIDKHLRGSTDKSPPPAWIADIEVPEAVKTLGIKIVGLEEEISAAQQRRESLIASKTELEEYQALLFGTGKALEKAIENALKLIGYSVSTYRSGDLEIDHVIVGPSGLRMIGESEGKDSSAIDIAKFRQLESNVGEDFERDEITEPAKGVLFGNGYRLTLPAERADQFTQKSLKNAKRLGSALVRTADLYPLVSHLLDHPADEAFKKACREALEGTVGEIVRFPAP